MKRKVLATACAGLMFVALAGQSYAHPSPPPPQPPAVHGGGGVGAGVVGGMILCVAGIFVAVAFLGELKHPGLCGIGAVKATCDDIRNASYPGDQWGNTPQWVKQQRLAENHCLQKPVRNIVRARG